MAGAMVEGWRKADADFSGVTVIRPSGTPVEGIRTATNLPDETPSFVMLGFKPQKLDDVAPSLAAKCGPDTVVVSLLAGVEVSSLRARFPTARSIVRVLPNLPVAIGSGVLPVHGDGDAVHEVVELMRPLGLVMAIKNEDGLAAIGAIAGAGPAYVARFADALGEAGSANGVEGDALAIALQTLVGTAALMQATGENGAQLAKRVASPGGTTEAGLAVLDADGALSGLVARTIDAAIRRGRELAEAAAIDPPDRLA
jgi:pyrroline-5-carboxylate reductase